MVKHYVILHYGEERELMITGRQFIEGQKRMNQYYNGNDQQDPIRGDIIDATFEYGRLAQVCERLYKRDMKRKR
jgi:hypothetical protein